MPIWLALFDAILTRRRPSRLVIGGLIAGIVGVAILLAPARGARRHQPDRDRPVHPGRDLLGGGLHLRQARAAATLRAARHRAWRCWPAAWCWSSPAACSARSARRTSKPSRLRSLVALALPDRVRLASSRSPRTPGCWPTCRSRPWGPTPTSTRSSRWPWAPSSSSEPITPRTLIASAIIIGAVVAMVSGRPRDADEPEPAPDGARLETE